MTYSYDFKKLILRLTAKKLMSNKTLSKYANVSKTSIYYWSKGKYLTNIKSTRKSKITPQIKCYILNYIIRKTNFNRFKLLQLIKKKYNVSISKSTLYTVMKKLNLRKKKYLILNI